MIDKQSFRTDVLTYFGATAAQVEELLVYNQNVFERNSLTDSMQFPLNPEAHISRSQSFLEPLPHGRFNKTPRH